jgi:uncharacterized membrane protein
MLRLLDSFVSELFRAEPQTVFAAAVAVASLLIYRRFRDGPTLLLLLGAAAQLVIFAGSALTSYAGTHDWIALDSFALSCCWPFVHSAAAIAAICFPAGLLWHALRINRNI